MSSLHSPPWRTTPEELHDLLRGTLATGAELRVLDAGCGAHGHVDMGPRARVVGIDLSEEQLERNRDLDEKIVGDLETYAFEPESFDVVVCWDVLEHLAKPRRAMEGLSRALKPGGVLVLALPNVLSIKGLITRFTPHRLHVWFHRTVLRQEKAGTDGHAPFRAYLRLAVSPSGIRDFARDEGLEVLFDRQFEGGQQFVARRRIPPVNWLFRVAEVLDRAVPPSIALTGSDCVFALRKPSASDRGADEDAPEADARAARASAR